MLYLSLQQGAKLDSGQMRVKLVSIYPTLPSTLSVMFIYTILTIINTT